MLLPDQTYEQACRIDDYLKLNRSDTLKNIKNILKKNETINNKENLNNKIKNLKIIENNKLYERYEDEIYSSQMDSLIDSHSESESPSETDSYSEDSESEINYELKLKNIINIANNKKIFIDKNLELPENYEKTVEFFNNIPDYCGEPFGPFSISNLKCENKTVNKINPNNILKEFEMFLYKYRIRPEFFCRYRKAMDATASAPPSWPKEKSQSTHEERKPQSASPPQKRLQTKMRRFKKCSAIYTLPFRSLKRPQHLHSSTDNKL